MKYKLKINDAQFDAIRNALALDYSEQAKTLETKSEPGEELTREAIEKYMKTIEKIQNKLAKARPW